MLSSVDISDIIVIHMFFLKECTWFLERDKEIQGINRVIPVKWKLGVASRKLRQKERSICLNQLLMLNWVIVCCFCMGIVKK